MTDEEFEKMVRFYFHGQDFYESAKKAIALIVKRKRCSLNEARRIFRHDLQRMYDYAGLSIQNGRLSQREIERYLNTREALQKLNQTLNDLAEEHRQNGCSICKGIGQIKCPICKGLGKLTTQHKKFRYDGGHDIFEETNACHNCGGTGLATCQTCSGRGYLR